MGVYGLWRLLDATGNQVPLETLEGKVLAIDVSIWIHQVLQGYQDRFGNPKPNAHLIGLFNRICKLLYYKIKPVFVFDGGVPMLKKDTIALRRKQKSIAKNKAEQMRSELINNLMKHSVVKTVLNTEKPNAANDLSEVAINLQTKPTMDDMFKLPEMPSTSQAEPNLSDDYDSDFSDELSPRKQTRWAGNIHSVDVTSAEFRGLPADVRYDILTDLKETRKQNSWGRLHEMPEEFHEFSGFQMKRLLKRRLVQESLESAEKEMGGKTLTLDDLDKLLTEQGVTTNSTNCTYRIAADSTTRLIYINDINKCTKDSKVNSGNEKSMNNGSKADGPTAGSSKVISISDDINEYEFSDEWDSDIEEVTAASHFTLPNEISSATESEVESNVSKLLSKKYFGNNATNPARMYMLEYSGLTEKQIINFFDQNRAEACKDDGMISETTSQIDSIEMEHLISACKHTSTATTTITTVTTATTATSTTNKNSNNNIDNRETVEPGETINWAPTSNAFSETSTEANVKLSPTEFTNTSSNAQIVSQDATISSSSDSNSDSDDFIEIQDAPLLELIPNANKSVPRQGIQITFRSDEKVVDDMFADVFDMPSSVKDTKVNSGNRSLSNQLQEESPKISDSDDQHSRKESSLPNTIIKSSEVLDRDKQLHSIKELEEFDRISTEKNVQPEKIEELDTNSINGPVAGTKNVSPIPVNKEELLTLQAELEDKQTELMANIGKLERQGIDICDQIRTEAQELLRLFGVPYVIAPMEAEAQCAYLEEIHLTNGTITDDSDIWLFGGQCVYKNFFDNNKKVLEFRSCDIQRHFKLTRNDMIRLALLVGSDYTTGLAGIGPVTALEILGAFPSESDNLLQSLMDFCSWIKSGRVTGPGKAALRNKLQNLEIRKGFPSQAVVQAYLFPKVDESKEAFSWGKLNNTLLSDYVKRKFGWDKDKYNKIMTPVLKRLEEKKTQNTIDAYFNKLQTVPKSIEMTMSKRVQKAVRRLNNEDTEDRACTETSVPEPVKKAKCSSDKGKRKKQVNNEQTVTDSCKPPILNPSARDDKDIEEYIPQREKDKANALKNKLHAIEVLRKSKQGLYKTKKVKRCVRKVQVEANLSESDSGSS